MTMKEELNRAGPMVDRLNAAIRENPLAAGLIGAGVAWMLFGGAKGVGLMAGAAEGAAGMAGSAAATAGSAASSGLTWAGSTARAGLKEVASASGPVASIVPDMPIPDTDSVVESVSGVGSAVADRINSAATAGRQYGAVMQSRLSENLERRPLLLGVIGLAIGAGIASTFATTAVESEMIGAQGTALREQLQGLTDDAKDRAKQVLSDVKNEAARQGLTPDAAKSAAMQIGEKVKTVAGAGRDSVAQRL